MSIILKLLSDPEVVIYFLALGGALVLCFKKSKLFWPLPASVFCMSLTWFYIMRWTFEYKSRGGMNLFDDAYVDVLNHQHWIYSSQLLSWAVVASLWLHEQDLCYLIFGMLGAMSSAFITLIPNKFKTPKEVRLLHVVTSLGAIYAIHQLPLSVNSPPTFSFWLKLLHLFIILPQICSLIISPIYKVGFAWVVGAVTAVLLLLHSFAPPFSVAPMPTTDCQLSIAFDLLFCSLLTTYAVYVETSNIYMTGMSVGLIAVLGPAIVLGGFLTALAVCDSHAMSIVWIQRAIARSLSLSTTSSHKVNQLEWMNLGLKADQGYVEGCERLALRLGSVALKEGDKVLSCGCGYGAELVLWKERYKLCHITGIDLNQEASSSFPLLTNVRLITLPVEDMKNKFLGKCIFNKILALDSVYHFRSKVQFFRDSFQLLSIGNTVGGVYVTDLVLAEGVASLPAYVRCLLAAMNVSTDSLWSQAEYKAQLESIKFVNVKVQPFQVSDVLGRWIPSAIGRYIEYALISAETPSNSVQTLSSVAVIGSGLSGLTAAHLLSGTSEVCLFESRDKCGLSGEGVDVFGQVVDIPLRIIGQGYYTYVESLAKSLDVSLRPIRDDWLTQMNYGDNGPRAPTADSFGYSHSFLSNLWSSLPHMMDILKFNHAVYRSSDSESGSMSGSNNETWGSWMTRHGYNTARYQSTDSYSAPLTGTNDSYVMWLLMGQVSWMLSCPFESVLNCPSDIILTFLRDLGVGRSLLDTIFLSSSRSGRMMRIRPSMAALENALTYGIQCNFSTKISNLDETLRIQGQRYDFVIIATEASAVQRILAPHIYPPVFSQVRYHPSSVVLHTDSSILPERREDWKTFNVCQQIAHDACMITAWLNDYFPDSCFPQDVFQTWNPHKRPDGIIKEAHFLRVVHSKETREILQKIAEVQGQHNIFYAGAYTVHGMGLLEQAARSGQLAVNLLNEKRLQH
jgi:uncharacterized protein